MAYLTKSNTIYYLELASMTFFLFKVSEFLLLYHLICGMYMFEWDINTSMYNVPAYNIFISHSTVSTF